MANHALPQTTSTYANFVTELDARLDDLALGLDPANTTATNLITNSIRWDSATNAWQKYNGSTWAALTAAYSININGTVGATTASTGAFTTLSSSSIASLGANSTVGAVPIVTTTGTQTLTNKTLTAPVIATITNNSNTLTLPTVATTLVGTNTTDTLENKTLTTPKFANAGYIADSNSNELLEFAVTAAAVNHVQVTNSATATNPAISAVGGDTNISLNLVPKGSGTVQVGGATIATISTTQTLTNKSLSDSTTFFIDEADATKKAQLQLSGLTTATTVTLTVPTISTTLVGRDTTDTLTNKTLTTPKFANAGFIADSNSNELLEFAVAASAVNHLVLANSAATADVTLTTAGTDTDINLNIVTKGAGTLKIDGAVAATVSDTQTLTNKSLTDSTTYFIDETTATKRMQFQLSGITAANTRTITIPDADITLFGTGSTDTLTNKTMSAGSVWNGGTIGVGYGGTGTNTAPVQGGIAYGSSVTQYATTAAGSTNQILQSNGTSAPTWAALDLALHLPDSSYKKIVRLATAADLAASTFAANVLTGYSASQTLLVTTNGTTTATTTSTTGIKVGAVISGNDVNITAGTTVASITNATTFVLSAAALTTSSANTTFTQAISALSVDGVAAVLSDRILVKDQSSLGGLSANTSALTNGIYTVTAIGSAAVPWVLTRAVDADSTADLDSAIVNVSIGTNNGSKTFHTTFLGSNTLNTTPMYWNRVVNTSASFFLPTPTTARGIDLDIEPKTVRLNTGALADLAINSFGIKTIESLAASTYTNAATVYIAGAPAASTNATITTPYALYVAGGNTLLAGNLTVSGGTITAGNVTTNLLGGNTSTNITIGGGLVAGTFTLGAAGSTGAVSLFPATGAQNITLGGATTATVTIGSTSATAVQLPSAKTKVGQTFITQGGAVTVILPTTAGTLVGSGDTGTVTNAMLAGSIANAKLASSSVTVGTTAISLGGSSTTLAGLTSVSSTGFTGPLTGNASTASTLETARTIGGVSFNGSANINLPGVNATGNQNTSGNAATATTFSTDRTNYSGVTNAAVSGQLMWKHFGNGHTIFDASNSTSPGGGAVNNTNATTAWTATYPTLMGWNGTDTYGVRVDSARISDSTSGSSASCTGNSATATTLQTARTIGGVSFNGSANINLPGVNTAGNQSTSGNAATATTATNQSGGTLNATTGTVTPNTSGVSTGFTVVNGDITTYRSGGTTGVIYLTNAGTKYLYYDGTNYNMPGGNIVSGNITAAGNVTGSSASCTGNAATATTAAACSGNSATATTAAACSGNSATATTAGTCSMSSGRTDTAAYPVVWGVTGATSQLYSCTAVNIQSSTGTLNATTIYATANVTAYSDARVKTNIVKIANALEKVQKLSGYTFDRTDITTPRQTGVIAQEVLAVLPEAVSTSETGMYGVSYGNMVGLLIEAIKEQQVEAEKQQQRIDKLEQLVLQLIGDNK